MEHDAAREGGNAIRSDLVGKMLRTGFRLQYGGGGAHHRHATAAVRSVKTCLLWPCNCIAAGVGPEGGHAGEPRRLFERK